MKQPMHPVEHEVVDQQHGQDLTDHDPKRVGSVLDQPVIGQNQVAAVEQDVEPHDQGDSLSLADPGKGVGDRRTQPVDTEAFGTGRQCP